MGFDTRPGKDLGDGEFPGAALGELETETGLLVMDDLIGLGWHSYTFCPERRRSCHYGHW